MVLIEIQKGTRYLKKEQLKTTEKAAQKFEILASNLKFFGPTITSYMISQLQTFQSYVFVIQVHKISFNQSYLKQK